MTPMMHQAMLDSNALLMPTRTGLTRIFDSLLSSVATELAARAQEHSNATVRPPSILSLFLIRN